MTGILWHNSESNAVQIWHMNGHQIAIRTRVLDEDSNPIEVGGPWSIAGVATDHAALAKPDIYWRDANSGMTLLWRMFNHKILSRAAAKLDGEDFLVGPPWQAMGVGPLGVDGGPGILWHHTDSDDLQIWFMNGPQIKGRNGVLDEAGKAIQIGPPWHVVGVGALGADGGSGILWHHTDSDDLQIWFMNGPQIKGRNGVVDEAGKAIQIGPPWHVVGVGALGADGGSGILWHNTDSDDLQIWFMNGPQIKGRNGVLDEAGNVVKVGPWQVKGVGEFTYGRIGPVAAEGYSTTPAGTFKGDAGEGVHGESHTGWAAVAGYNQKDGPGVWGVGGPSGGEGVHGESHSGFAAVAGYSKGTGAAGFFEGNVVVTGDVILQGADYAEALTTTDVEVKPGMVVVLGDDGEVHPCERPYDTRVAGIVSGAGGVKPALVLDRHDNSAHIALMGKVWCCADSEQGEIRPGDLLTTSTRPGHCQRVTDTAQAFGGVIGKALTPLPSGQGLVRVLVGRH